jgi:hypothetical protein
MGASPPAVDGKAKLNVYIDNSNVWIQGQKTYARDRNYTTDSDNTWRVGFSRLINTVMQHSRLRYDKSDYSIDAYMYGSGSSYKMDEFAAEMGAKHGIKMRMLDRSLLSGKEKEVDTTLVAELVEEVMHLHYEGPRHSEFVIVSGDKDLRCGARMAAKYGFPVHVWAWENSMSKEYTSELRRADGVDDSLIQTYPLDPYERDIGYNDDRFDRVRQPVPMDSLVVLNTRRHTAVVGELLASISMPTRTVEMTRQQQQDVSGRKRDAKAQEPDLVVTFAHRINADDHTKLAAELIAEFKPRGLQILHWLEYKQHYLNAPSETGTTTSNRFSDIFDQEEDEEDEAGNDTRATSPMGVDDTEDAGWTEVKKKTPKGKPETSNQQTKKAEVRKPTAKPAPAKETPVEAKSLGFLKNKKQQSPQQQQPRQSTHATPPPSNGGWTQVNDQHTKQLEQRRRNRLKSLQRCYWRAYCERGTVCKYAHTRAEKAAFASVGPKSFAGLRVAKCRWGQKCVRGQCRHAHEMSEFFCPTCGAKGKHDMMDCNMRYQRAYVDDDEGREEEEE